MDFKDPQNKKQLQKNITTLMKEYSDKLIAMSESNDYKKSALLYYWLQDYKNMLNRENNFSPKFMKKYSCGDIINVNFGFRPGAEEGGLHYAVVLDNNPRSSSVVTVIPLRSKKNKDAILRPFEVDLGEVLSTRIAAKTSTLIKEYKIMDSEYKLRQKNYNKACNDLSNQLKKLEENYSNDADRDLKIIPLETKLSILSKENKILNTQIATLKLKQGQLNKHIAAFEKMRKGSIALISQITTISKMRIMDPIKETSVLTGISLPKQTMEKIYDKLIPFISGKNIR